MMPTTEIELNEITEVQPANENNAAKAPRSQRFRQTIKKKADTVYYDLKTNYRETQFTPEALRPVDRSVILFFLLIFVMTGLCFCYRVNYCFSLTLF